VRRRGARSAPQPAQQQRAGESHQGERQKHEQDEHRRPAEDRGEGVRITRMTKRMIGMTGSSWTGVLGRAAAKAP
jgi:hypothetical protein